jgi:DNA mismatch repair protein MutS2
LFLIDEFGAGTEPQFGGAIAESILGALVSKGARGLVTTHYGNLKKFAEINPFIENAAMRFDLEKLVPLYILEVGRPGSSFALEIARKIGLPEDVLKVAQDKIGRDPVTFEKLVSELEQEKQMYDEYNEDNQRLKADLEKQTSKYDRLLSELQQQRKEIINQAKQEAQQLLKEANQRIEATIRSIKEHKAEKTNTKEVRRTLQEFKEKTKPEKIQKPVAGKVIPGPIKKGDIVRLKNSEARGEVVNIFGKSAEILMGSLKSKVNLDRLEKIGKAVSETSGKVSSNIDLHRKRANYSTQLNIRGFRADEAIRAVMNFIDEGILLGMTELRILHGKGDGILRTDVREQLMKDPAIASIRDEHVERGGAGVTLVTLK